jgi:hypothetical protein
VFAQRHATPAALTRHGVNCNCRELASTVTESGCGSAGSPCTGTADPYINEHATPEEQNYWSHSNDDDEEAVLEAELQTCTEALGSAGPATGETDEVTISDSLAVLSKNALYCCESA